VSDDIVIRLRDAAPIARATDINTDNGVEYSWPLKHMLLDAANEIEQLRIQIAKWKELSADLAMDAAMQELKKAANP
jgi:hypothetical protein